MRVSAHGAASHASRVAAHRRGLQGRATWVRPRRQFRSARYWSNHTFRMKSGAIESPSQHARTSVRPCRPSGGEIQAVEERCLRQPISDRQPD